MYHKPHIRCTKVTKETAKTKPDFKFLLYDRYRSNQLRFSPYRSMKSILKPIETTWNKNMGSLPVGYLFADSVRCPSTDSVLRPVSVHHASDSCV